MMCRKAHKEGTVIAKHVGGVVPGNTEGEVGASGAASLRKTRTQHETLDRPYPDDKAAGAVYRPASSPREAAFPYCAIARNHLQL